MSIKTLLLLVSFAEFRLFKCTPIVLWHGFGNDHLESIKEIIRTTINESVYIKSIQLGDSSLVDFERGIFVHPNDQIFKVCNEIAMDENLRDGFHAVGFSQGAQFLRGLIQRCAPAKVFNFISLGGQHQGVYGVPACSSQDHSICKLYRFIINYFAYTNWAQKHIVQATYWHDPYNEDTYRRKSSFLADINNERDINENYIRRLQSINNFVMVKFLQDKIVQPIETSWFGFFKPESEKRVLSLSESKIFIDDKLGLKRMMEDGRLVFLEVDDEHVTFPDEWFVEKIVPFLSSSIASTENAIRM